jgi:hypothetical protein
MAGHGIGWPASAIVAAMTVFWHPTSTLLFYFHPKFVARRVDVTYYLSVKPRAILQLVRFRALGS